MDKINIQMKPYQMQLPVRITLIVVGLIVAGLAFYKSYHAHSAINIVFMALGFTAILLGLNLFGNSKRFFVSIDDFKIEYNIGNIGRPTIIMIDTIDSINYNDKRLRFDFRLKTGHDKKLYLRMIPKDRRIEIVTAINTISIDGNK